MQAVQISTKCAKCGILLAGREQFMGHMMHGHDMSFEETDVIWKVKSVATHNTH